MAVVRGDEVFKEVQKLFNLPDSCKSVVIRMAVNELVEIDCEYFPDKGTGEPITQTFNLVPVEPDAVDVTTLASDAREYRVAEPLDCVGVKSDSDVGKSSRRQPVNVPSNW